MADHTDNALRAAIRALDEVIYDAIDPNHPLAHEQTKLVSKYLQLILSRQEYAHDRLQFDLSHYIEMAEHVKADANLVSPAISQALEETLAKALQLKQSSSARELDLRNCSQKLAAILTALVRTTSEANHELRKRIEKIILLDSKAFLDAQRAWFLPQGWEPKPELVPSIEQVFQIKGR
jgi:hypothetical protein